MDNSLVYKKERTIKHNLNSSVLSEEMTSHEFRPKGTDIVDRATRKRPQRHFCCCCRGLQAKKIHCILEPIVYPLTFEFWILLFMLLQTGFYVIALIFYFVYKKLLAQNNEKYPDIELIGD